MKYKHLIHIVHQHGDKELSLGAQQAVPTHELENMLKNLGATIGKTVMTLSHKGVIIPKTQLREILTKSIATSRQLNEELSPAIQKMQKIKNSLDNTHNIIEPLSHNQALSSHPHPLTHHLAVKHTSIIDQAELDAAKNLANTLQRPITITGRSYTGTLGKLLDELTTAVDNPRDSQNLTEGIIQAIDDHIRHNSHHHEHNYDDDDIRNDESNSGENPHLLSSPSYFSPYTGGDSLPASSHYHYEPPPLSPAPDLSLKRRESHTDPTMPPNLGNAPIGASPLPSPRADTHDNHLSSLPYTPFESASHTSDQIADTPSSSPDEVKPEEHANIQPPITDSPYIANNSENTQHHLHLSSHPHGSSFQSDSLSPSSQIDHSQPGEPPVLMDRHAHHFIVDGHEVNASNNPVLDSVLNQLSQQKFSYNLLTAFTSAGAAVSLDGTGIADVIGPNQLHPGDVVTFEKTAGLFLGNNHVLIDGKVHDLSQSVVDIPGFRGFYRPRFSTEFNHTNPPSL